MAEWQPIATAPKGGIVLAYVPDELSPYDVQFARWDDDWLSQEPRPFWKLGECETAAATYSRAHQPTHWMPLPEPPK